MIRETAPWARGIANGDQHEGITGQFQRYDVCGPLQGRGPGCGHDHHIGARSDEWAAAEELAVFQILEGEAAADTGGSRLIPHGKRYTMDALDISPRGRSNATRF
jgi:hypothetical protein